MGLLPFFDARAAGYHVPDPIVPCHEKNKFFSLCYKLIIKRRRLLLRKNLLLDKSVNTFMVKALISLGFWEMTEIFAALRGRENTMKLIKDTL